MIESIRWKSDGGEMELFVSNGKVTITLEAEDVKTYVSLSPDQAVKLAGYITKFAIDEALNQVSKEAVK